MQQERKVLAGEAENKPTCLTLLHNSQITEGKKKKKVPSMDIVCVFGHLRFSPTTFQQRSYIFTQTPHCSE